MSELKILLCLEEIANWQFKKTGDVWWSYLGEYIKDRLKSGEDDL